MSGDMRRWLSEGRHLPPFMRDFHAQKAIFKDIGLILTKAKQEDEDNERVLDTYILKDLNWINLHVGCIDFFLWYMAMRGYTLQRNRARMEWKPLPWNRRAAERREGEKEAVE